MPAHSHREAKGFALAEQGAGIQRWIPAFAGMSGVGCPSKSLFRFSFQTARVANAPPPLLFGRRRVTPVFQTARSRNENRGRAGRPGPNGPARLGTSRHQAPSARASRRCGGKRPRAFRASQGHASPPVPRRPARGVYRFAPHGPRWTYLSGNLPYGAAYPPLAAQTMPGTSDRAAPPSAGPRGARLARRDTCGLDRRAVQRISAARHSPATAPRPVSEDAVQTPLGNEAGCHGL